MLGMASLAIKYLLFIFNLIIFLSGILLLSVGLSIRNVYIQYELFLNENYFTAPYLLIIVGLIVLSVSFFGCCGTLKENNCMMHTFGILLGTCFLMELTGGLAGFILSEKAYSVVTNNLHDTMLLYNKTNQITHIWDGLQTTLQCCGAENVNDWYVILNNKLPMSCCGPVEGAIGQQSCTKDSDTLYKQPCYESLTKIVKENASTLGCVAMGIALLQEVGVNQTIHSGFKR
ncbi:CD63 antigen-like isoform X2 [Daktulosphaira vitifoliae]|uniref:CD63 antigen-like isoform X2 n=1 Tax=Daktulosphaira vitifoliae TaxID=58002 RepID=UPI0021A99192|nr:CD63 antigen-like isoform X2 [Daktulosphaira vitifoliae]